MSADLVAWLRACLDEDEQAAEAAEASHPSPWRHRDHESDPWIVTDATGEFVVHDDGAPSDVGAAHIARWDPARVLAEVTAKREIIEEHHLTGSDLYDDGIVWCQTCSPRTTGPCRTLRLLAAPYASRPGFDPSWLD